MKKKIAALLCGTMCIGAFTGCSVDELAYLKMSSELSQTMESCNIKGSMKADVNFDEMYNYVIELAESATGEEGWKIDRNEELLGKQEIVLDYDMDVKGLDFKMSADLTFDGKKYDMGTMYASAKEGSFVTSSTILSMVDLMEDLALDDDKEYKQMDEYEKEFRALVEDKEYIKVADAEEVAGINVGEMITEENAGEVGQAAFELVFNIMEGFDTGAVKAVSNGYEVNVSGKEAGQMVADLLYFFGENPERMLDEVEKFGEKVVAVSEKTEELLEAKAELDAAVAEKRGGVAEFTETMNGLGELLEEVLADATVNTVLESIHLNEKIVKDGDAFKTTSGISIKNGSKSIVALEADAVIAAKDVNLVMPKDYMEMETLEEKMDVLENKYDPVTKVQVTWGYTDMPEEADLYTYRNTGRSFDFATIMVKDGRAYLPLRAIAEALGEEVGWENATKTPYVMKDGQRIDMKGMLRDGRAYVGIRDFEKLNYTVTYEKDDMDLSHAYIVK